MFSNEPDVISIMVDVVKAETDAAILVGYCGSDIWLPKSQLEDWPDLWDGGEVLIREWLAVEKGMV